jgi:hypothetical protein
LNPAAINQFRTGGVEQVGMEMGMPPFWPRKHR